ncbi:ParE toxin of type II toxin-antitoxin system, parDE [uncultured archaeon]|nr:ParE toxin of type II toxin-antitoxin system, parDE [uncultured archaeon]
MPAVYALELRESVTNIFEKLEKKDKRQLIEIRKKIASILENPNKFKPLRAPLQGVRRVHVMGSFVLIYSVVEEKHTVIIEDYAHHDEIYE